MSEKKCRHCGSPMTRGNPAKNIHISRKDWASLRSPSKHANLEKTLRIMEENWLCLSCLEKARNGPFIDGDAMLAELLGCSAAEAREKAKQRSLERQRERTPEDEIIRVTIDEVRAALESAKRDQS